MARQSRGIRNNNPGNIKYVKSTNWRGKVSDSEKKDSTFEEFTEMKYGVRALARILKSYVKNPKVRTLQDMINRFAPPVENNTSAYVKRVAKDLEVDIDVLGSKLVNNPVLFEQLIYSITKHETGKDIGIDVIKDGIILERS
jgi:hypothetical protein